MKRLITSACAVACTAMLVACANQSKPHNPTPGPTPANAPAIYAEATSTPAPELTPTATRHPIPIGTPTLDPPRPVPASSAMTVTYTVQRGDTLSGIAYATGTTPDELQRLNGLRNPNALQVGQQLLIRRQIEGRTPSVKLIPDSELVNGPTAAEFDTAAFISRQGGYLGRYTEVVAGEMLTGAQIVQRVAEQFSVHPRILLAALEHVGGWVTRAQPSDDQLRYPLGYKRTNREGLNVQLNWAALRLNEGYYGWRLNTRSYVRLDDGTYFAIGEGVNAGTAGLQNYLAAISTVPDWPEIAENDGDRAFIHTYRRLFGNPWQYDFGPLVPDDLKQPPFVLPWRKGEMWYFTGGPHSAWGAGTPWGALDFTPVTVAGCTELEDWVTAVADGVITRSVRGEVGQSLDPSRDERIGWSVLYLHIGSRNRVPVGTQVRAGDPIGHPSCEGGLAAAAHVHLARKYNGEWINAQGKVPFDLEGWVAVEGAREYDGALVNGDLRREPCECKYPDLNGIVR
ncbi:MAG: LysM peptidoglycan-binding domain-containing protein [Anaerolineae bacterium]|nr:LysM peptidoglycan-binding domain-containing protein [Anaerolineae bacterium]